MRNNNIIILLLFLHIINNQHYNTVSYTFFNANQTHTLNDKIIALFIYANIVSEMFLQIMLKIYNKNICVKFEYIYYYYFIMYCVC